jgi:hypothetical protein|tara:strand:- start:190 stop:351 length:162 start_codon:yes stop_codon:yes gene_type:complete
MLRRFFYKDNKLIGRWKNNNSKEEKMRLVHYANLDNCGAEECKKLENYKLKYV